MATVRRSAPAPGRAIALCLLFAALAACGAEPTAAPTPVAELEPAAPPDTAVSPSPAGFWRTDVAVGSGHGDRAANASITLVDGASATLESAAGGRAVLLYFFATW